MAGSPFFNLDVTANNNNNTQYFTTGLASSVVFIAYLARRGSHQSRALVKRTVCAPRRHTYRLESKRRRSTPLVTASLSCHEPDQHHRQQDCIDNDYRDDVPAKSITVYVEAEGEAFFVFQLTKLCGHGTEEEFKHACK